MEKLLKHSRPQGRATFYMVNIQKYRFIADLLTTWEANGYAMGVDQQLKIRALLQKIPDDYTLADLKTLLAPIFAHDAKQQEAFYELYDKLLPQQTDKPISEPQTTTLPTSDIPNPTSDTPSVFRLKNKKLWWTVGVSVVIGALVLIFLDEILNLFKRKPIPERYVKVDLIYDAKKPEIRTFKFDSVTPSVKSIGLVSSNEKLKGLKISITNRTLAAPFFTAEAERMPKNTIQIIDTAKLSFSFRNGEKKYIYYVFTITNKGVIDTSKAGFVQMSLKPYNHTPDTSSLRPQETLQFNPSEGSWSWIKMGGWGLFGAAILGISYWRRRKEQLDLAARRDNKTKPPYSWKIKIEGIENAIQLNDTFFRTANDMRRRSEMDIQRLDMPRTIKATIRRAGMPSFTYRQPTQANEYLVLIDQSAAQSHRAKLFDYLMRRWQQQEVLVERFFFNGDMRLCWNEKYQRGLSIAELQQCYPKHRLIVVGHGFWLLKTKVVELDEWTAGLLDTWRYKVLITPRMPNEWDARETVLSKKFRILPAILRGVGDLAETLNAVETSDFKRWQELELEEAEPIRLPKKLSAETLMIFLESHFITYVQGGKRDDRMLQWIAACAVSPLIHWDLTLAFGQLISANNPETDSLVSLDSIFQLTRLSWFNDATMPDEARRPLLDWLEKTHPSVLQQVRAKWAEILTINKPPTDSIAFDDYSLALTINALNQKPTSRQKQKLNEELERSLVNEPRQDFLVLDYLAAQRTPLDAFVPKRFKDYLRDPERRIPTLRAWIWQVPLWLLGGFLLFSFNYSPDCTEGVAMNKTRMACIKNDQDILTLNEYAICDVLDKNYWRLSDVKADSVVAWLYFNPSANGSQNYTQRVDEDLLATAQKRIRANGLDSISFYRNLKIAYANAAIQYINKNNKDSACIYIKLYANLPTNDSVLTIEEWNYFNQMCNPQSVSTPDNTFFGTNKNIPPRIVTKLPSQQSSTAPITQSQTQQNNNPYKDTTQQQEAKIADVLSLSISGLQKDIVTIGESLNINYALSNDGKDVINNITLWFSLNETVVGTAKIEAMPNGETKRGAQKITIPKDAKVGRQTLNIRAEWQGQTLNSNSQMLEISTGKGATKY